MKYSQCYQDTFFLRVLKFHTHTHKHTKPGLFSVTRVVTALYASPMMYSG